MPEIPRTTLSKAGFEERSGSSRGVQRDGRDDIEEMVGAPALEFLLQKSAQARAQADHANAANAANNAMLAALAHELRAPLASILLYAQLLRESEVVEQRDLKHIGDSLERAVQQQVQLIDQLLDGSCDTSHDATLERRGHDNEAAADATGAERHGTWTLTFPLTPARHASDSAEKSQVSSRSLDRPGKVNQYERLKDVRILCIDDDFGTREAVFEVLELTGARVALAASAADGMMALQTFKPHVIVCDLAMPGEDGYAFMRKLRASETGQASAIPVLAFTGLASANDKLAALAAGFQMYLSKPIDIDRLRDSVAQLVDLSASGNREPVGTSA